MNSDFFLRFPCNIFVRVSLVFCMSRALVVSIWSSGLGFLVLFVKFCFKYPWTPIAFYLNRLSFYLLMLLISCQCLVLQILIVSISICLILLLSIDYQSRFSIEYLVLFNFSSYIVRFFTVISSHMICFQSLLVFVLTSLVSNCLAIKIFHWVPGSLIISSVLNLVQ